MEHFDLLNCLLCMSCGWYATLNALYKLLLPVRAMNQNEWLRLKNGVPLLLLVMTPGLGWSVAVSGWSSMLYRYLMLVDWEGECVDIHLFYGHHEIANFAVDRIWRNIPVLIWYIGDCMVSITNINNGIKEPICGHQNCNTGWLIIFSEYVKRREFLYARVIIGVNTILDHIDTSVIFT